MKAKIIPITRNYRERKILSLKVTRAVIYLRVASAHEADRKAGFAIQKQKLKQYCKQNGIKITGIYEEALPTSSSPRPIYQQMLSFLQQNKGAVDLLLVTTPDRLSRRIPEAIQMMSELNHAGIKVKAINEPKQALATGELAGFTTRLSDKYISHE